MNMVAILKQVPGRSRQSRDGTSDEVTCQPALPEGTCQNKSQSRYRWFTIYYSEDYERAKNILKSEYGKISEVVNAYI